MNYRYFYGGLGPQSVHPPSYSGGVYSTLRAHFTPARGVY